MTIKKITNGRLPNKVVETPPELERCMMCWL